MVVAGAAASGAAISGAAIAGAACAGTASGTSSTPLSHGGGEAGAPARASAHGANTVSRTGGRGSDGVAHGAGSTRGRVHTISSDDARTMCRTCAGQCTLLGTPTLSADLRRVRRPCLREATR